MKLLHIAPPPSATNRNAGIDFLVEPLIAPGRDLSKYFTVLIASPYLDGAVDALKVLDRELGKRGCKAFVIILTDQHDFSPPSPAIKALVAADFKNLYGVAFDAAEGKLFMHSKLYSAWQYCPTRKDFLELENLPAGELRDRLVDLIHGGVSIGSMNAKYEQIFAAVGSANCTEAALVNGEQHEILIRSEDPEFCKDCRKLFGNILKSYATPERHFF